MPTKRTERLLSRMLAMAIATIFFSIFTAGQGGLQANWIEISGTLLLFGIIYELLAWFFFQLFKYFAEKGDNNDGTVVTVPANEIENN